MAVRNWATQACGDWLLKVFISSLITGFGSYRDAARRAVITLRNEAIMAEDFGAQRNSSQIACLQGARTADLVIFILGSDYGFVPSGSTISATMASIAGQ